MRSSREASVNVQLGEHMLNLTVPKGVFNPQRPDLSASSKSELDSLEDMAGKRVLDMGCGSGVLSIAALMYGADNVWAVDISPYAVWATFQNVLANLPEMAYRLTVKVSDLFTQVEGEFDLVMANLPIVDATDGDLDMVSGALCDPGLVLHRRFFSEAKEYLAEGGKISLTHANLQSVGTDDPERDFRIIEEMMKSHGYTFEREDTQAIGVTWAHYVLSVHQ